MPRRPRRDLGDGIFHVVNRGTNRSEIYLDDTDRKTFLTIFGTAVVRHGWMCHAFCLMTNHYHLVLEAENAELSRGMHLLNSRYSHYFNRRHNRDGHLFKARYAVYVIDDEDRLDASCQYVLNNPVRAGLCASPTDWPWSGRPSLAAESFQ